MLTAAPFIIIGHEALQIYQLGANELKKAVVHMHSGYHQWLKKLLESVRQMDETKTIIQMKYMENTTLICFISFIYHFTMLHTNECVPTMSLIAFLDSSFCIGVWTYKNNEAAEIMYTNGMLNSIQ